MKIKNSYWIDQAQKNVPDPLPENISDLFDVAIIGAGFAGLNAAFHLCQNNLKVIIIDEKYSGSGASAFNAGFISNFPLRPVNKFFSKQYMLLPRFHEESLSYITSFINDNNIDCNFSSNGLVILCKSENSTFSSLKKIDDLTCETDVFGFNVGYLKNDSYSLNPYKFIEAVRSQIKKNQATIIEGVAACKIEKYNQEFQIKLGNNQVIRSKKIITSIGSGTISNEYIKEFEGFFYPIKSGIVVTDVLKESQILSISKYNRIFLTEGVNLHYFRVTDDKRLLFGGKQTIRNVDDETNRKFLNSKINKFFPFLNNVKIDFHWQKILNFNLSGLPIVSCIDNDLFYINGFCGSGIASSSYCGFLAAKAITGNSFHKIFSIRHRYILKILKTDLARRVINFLI